MSELVEKVARALCEADTIPPASANTNWEFYREEFYLPQARTALSAIEAEGMVVVPKEPTTRQLAAGQTAWLADPLKRSSTLYRAMIVAAKGEG